jgi:hypothetical protein
MATFKEDRIARGWKKRFPKKKKGQMTKKEEHEFFGHKFECKKQKLTLFGQKISTESEEVYDIYCDKNGQICEVMPVGNISKRS